MDVYALLCFVYVKFDESQCVSSKVFMFLISWHSVITIVLLPSTKNK